MFFILYLLTIATSTLLNQDPLEYAGTDLPGSTPYDIISNCTLDLLVFIPFVIGRNVYNRIEDTEYMFKALTVFALIYSVLMFYEIRMSPHLHESIYGYFPSDYVQAIRGDSVRPIVFIGHGLALAFWFSIATIAALALHKAKVSVQLFGRTFSGLKLLIYLIVALLACQTASVVIYIIIAIIMIFFMKEKKQMTLSLVMTAMVMVYPINATSQFIKYSDVLEFVGQYSDERKDSLQTRFLNETRLTVRALERPYFGWSGWGRSRVYQGGRDITVTDGEWIITLGHWGLVGFVLYYLMLIYPIILARKSYRYITNEKHRIYFVTLVIMLAIGIVDSVPNTGMMPVHMLLAGALLGQSELVKKRYFQEQREKIRQQSES